MKGQALGVAAAISAEGDAEGESPQRPDRERSSEIKSAIRTFANSKEKIKLRLKLLGLVALAALVAAMGVAGLKTQRADAAVTTVTLTGGAGGVFQWSVTVNADETDTLVLSTSLLPSGATGVFGGTCTTTADGVCAGTASAAGPGGLGALPTFTMTAAQMAAVDLDTVADTVTVAGTLTVTGASVGTNITVTASATAGAAGVTSGPAVVDTANSPACTQSTSLTVVSVCKVDQRGTRISATFALSGPNFLANIVTGPTPGGAGCTSAVLAAGPCTVTAAPFSNPCRTDWECTRVLQNGVVSAPVSLGISALPAGTYTLTEATAGGYSCTQIQVVNGFGQVLPPGQPITITLPATDARALNFTFTNSCLLPGGPAGAGSSVVAVIGGSTFGLTNSTNVEINPAPGSDDDARLDVRIRDAANIPLPNAHVFVMTDKGRLAVRQDLSGVGIAGYDVGEPVAPLFGTNGSGDSCDQIVGTTLNPFASPQPIIPASIASFVQPYNAGSAQIQDGFTNFDGILSACLYVNDSMVPGITPGKANITVIVEAPNQYFGVGYIGGGAGNLVLTAVVTVVGPPASIKVSASPTTLQCGEKSTITATVTDAVGQNVSDHTRVELVSNFGATIGGTGSTLGYPGVGAVNPISSSAAETFSGVATAFLLTSTEHVGPYEVVVASGGSVGGSPAYSAVYPGTPLTSSFFPGTQLGGLAFPIVSAPTVNNTGGVFSTAPVSAQATVTCALPVAAAPVVPPIVAPRTGEGIRPPNTGDAGLADASGSSWAFVLAGAVAFALAGIASVKFARR